MVLLQLPLWAQLQVLLQKRISEQFQQQHISRKQQRLAVELMGSTASAAVARSGQ
jgi:hypothetical protein